MSQTVQHLLEAYMWPIRVPVSALGLKGSHQPIWPSFLANSHVSGLHSSDCCPPSDWWLRRIIFQFQYELNWELCHEPQLLRGIQTWHVRLVHWWMKVQLWGRGGSGVGKVCDQLYADIINKLNSIRIQHIFIEHLICARQCVKLWWCKNNKNID